MMTLPRRQFILLTAAASFPAVSRFASAQNFPLRPITVVVSTGAGGPADVIARIVAERMRASLDQTVIVENSGGIGTVGMNRVPPRPSRMAIRWPSAPHFHARGARRDPQAALRRGR